MLESGNKKIQNAQQVAILKVTYLKINRLLSIHSSNVLLKFGLDIQSQTKVFVSDMLKINRLLPMAINNMHMKFQIEILKQT